MKQKFSTSWLSSVQVRKQRKYRYNAPLHVKHKFLSAHLSKELRKKYGKRSVPLRKGDEVLIMRGSFKKKKGKIVELNLKRSRVSVENMTRQKRDGTKVNAYFNASSLQVITLILDDSKRMKIARREAKKENKPKETETKDKEKIEKNASDKNASK